MRQASCFRSAARGTALLITLTITAGATAQALSTKGERKAMRAAKAEAPTGDFDRHGPAERLKLLDLYTNGAEERATIAHPTLADIDLPPFAERGDLGPLPAPEVLDGPYINFESPPYHPIAVHEDSGRVIAVNTPNGSLVVFDTTATGLRKVSEIPVGIDPVSAIFIPRSDGELALVANFVSDTVVKVDLITGQVVAVMKTPDEPIHLLAKGNGADAFVVCQSGDLVAFDAGAMTQTGQVTLSCNTPRGAIFDPVNNVIVVSALHSGANTTTIGHSIRWRSQAACDPNDPNTCPNTCNGGLCNTSIVVPSFIVAAFISSTADAVFASPYIPWPPETAAPLAAPPVTLIVPDPGRALDNVWAEVFATLSDGAGAPDPGQVALLETEWLAATGTNLLNAEEILQTLITDLTDTEDADLIVIDVSTPSAMAIAKTTGNVGGTLPGMGFNPVTRQIFVSNLQPMNHVLREPTINGRFLRHEIVTLADTLNPTVVQRHQVAGGSASMEPFSPDAATPTRATAERAALGGLPVTDQTAVGTVGDASLTIANPLELVAGADGARVYTVALGNSVVAALDGASGAPLQTLPVGAGPRGLAIDNTRGRLYTLNRTDHTISVVSIPDTGMQPLATVSLFNPEPPVIRNGRDFLYNTRRGALDSFSCASCHIDGRLDHTAWDLGDPHATDLLPAPPIFANLPDLCNTDVAVNHPVKGPMVTQSFQGLDRRKPFHWRGDKPEFTDFNGAFASLLGGSEIPDADMVAFSEFVMTIAYPPNPFRTRDNGFQNPDAIPGATIFANNCQVCHFVQDDGAMHCPDQDVDMGFELGALQTQLVPQLRGIHKKFIADKYNGHGLLHDGQEKSRDNNHPLETFVEVFFPGLIPVQHQLIAFVDAFSSNVMPVVGMQALALDPNDPALAGDVMTMVNQFDQSPSHCDVIVKVRVQGRMHGLVLESIGAAPMFRADDNSLLSLTLLSALASPATPMLFTAVPPGSGVRAGIDQDMDGTPDALDSCPQSAAPACGTPPPSSPTLLQIAQTMFQGP